MSKETDKAAEKILGVRINNVSDSDLEYLRLRARALESVANPEPLLLQEALLTEYNITLFRRRQQELQNAKPSDTSELEFTQEQLRDLATQLDAYMERYNAAMESLGARKKQKSDVQTSPLSELWQRYTKAIEELKIKRGEEVGSPTKEALELAAAKGDKTDYKIKGTVSPAVRKKAIDSITNPDEIDEKKNVMALGVMIDDFLHDPCLAAACIFQEVLFNNPPIPPVQELRIFGMWKHKFFVDSSGFGTGKTFCGAIVCALRCVLIADRHIGILSATFPQGKLFFEQHFDPWVKKCPIFAAQLEVSIKGGGYHIMHGDDAHTMYYRNHSTLKTIPPNFMNDAQRLKSESWTDGVGDEWTAWSNLGRSLPIFQGRVRRPIGRGYPEGDPIFDHHQSYLGAADFTWRACYEVLQQYQRKVGSGKHCVQAWNYMDYTPKWRKQQYGVDVENIESMMETMTRDERRRIVFAEWMNDSTGWYMASEIKACRATNDDPMRGNDEWIKFAGVDLAPGSIESMTKLGGGTKGNKSGDDFSFVGWRYREGERAEPFYALRICGLRAPHASSIIHRLHQQHRFVTIMCDVGGGGQELYHNVKQPVQIEMGFGGVEEKFDVTPLILQNDEQMAGIGDPVWAFFKRGEPAIFGTDGNHGVIWPPYPGESHLPNQMHRIAQGAIQNKLWRLPELWAGWKDEMGLGTEDANYMRTWLNEHPGFVGDDRSRAEIDLAIQQLIQIERENDREGKPKQDKFGQFTFMSRYKKDSAYAMLMGYFAVWLFIERSKQEQQDGSGEEGEVIFSASEVHG